MMHLIVEFCTHFPNNVQMEKMSLKKFCFKVLRKKLHHRFIRSGSFKFDIRSFHFWRKDSVIKIKGE